MIMAAGVGTRLDPLTQKVPKPLVPVANRPIMDLILRHIKKYGITDVIANTHYLGDSIHEYFDEIVDLNINLNYVYEEQLSGTAGGVKKCEWFFDKGETFVVVSGDALTDVDLNALIQEHKKSDAIATMALKRVPLSEVSHFGVVIIDDNSKVIEFQEKPSISEAKSNLVNTGIYIFETEIFDFIPQNQFYDFAKNVFPAIMNSDKVLGAHIIDEYWSDIGTIGQYRMSMCDILDGKVHMNLVYKKMENGWYSDDADISASAVNNGKVVVGKDSIIKDNTKFFGYTSIGKNCIIKEGAIIRNSIIWDNVIIESNVKLDGCIIASNSTIGKSSILLPGCILPDGTIIEPNQSIENYSDYQNKDLVIKS
jgi:mannose-1-phosphate guanylyltransferase/mannose-1-phosphate guanylyltransferase/phosphomannomutase